MFPSPRRSPGFPRIGPPWSRRPGRPLPLADAPAPVRVMLGLGLLGLCMWLPAMIALFR